MAAAHRLRREIQRLRAVFLGDALFACQPFCEAGGNFILTVKPSSNKLLYEYVDNRNLRVKHRAMVTEKRKKITIDHRWRWIDDVPVRDGDTNGTWIEYSRTYRGTGRTTTSAKFTVLKVNRRNVEEIITCGRAR